MAGKAVAAMLRLEKKEGMVTIKNKSGGAITASEGIKLYQGYTLETGAASYVFVSLDGKTAAKLEASSRAEVKEAGDKLELVALSGKLLMDVAVPAANGGNANIRTSSTITGIRG